MINILNFDKKDLKEIYVRCEYCEGLFEDEAGVRVGLSEQWMYVNKTELIRLKNGGYGIRALEIRRATSNLLEKHEVERIFFRKEGEVYVLIQDRGDYKMRIREVALDDIVDVESEVNLGGDL